MSVIVNAIPPQSYELVRDQIANILQDELENQFDITGNEDFNITVWRERKSTNFDFTELGAINVIFDGVPYESQDAKQQAGVYTYFIDCYVRQKATDNELPDTKAMVRLHRLLGVCRAILMDARYKTLGFEPPFIGNRVVQAINIEDPGLNDMTTTIRGRLTLAVKMQDITELKVPIQLQEFLSEIRLELTDIGYIWVDISI